MSISLRYSTSILDSITSVDADCVKDEYFKSVERELPELAKSEPSDKIFARDVRVIYQVAMDYLHLVDNRREGVSTGKARVLCGAIIEDLGQKTTKTPQEVFCALTSGLHRAHPILGELATKADMYARNFRSIRYVLSQNLSFRRMTGGMACVTSGFLTFVGASVYNLSTQATSSAPYLLGGTGAVLAMLPVLHALSAYPLRQRVAEILSRQDGGYESDESSEESALLEE